MQDTLIYRRATEADLEQVKALGLISYGKYAPLLKPEYAGQFTENMKNTGYWTSLFSVSKGFVCVSDHTIVGMAFLIPSGNPWTIFKAEWSYIRMVGVHPGYEGRGIARALTNKCVDYAKTSGEKIIALHTSEMMNAARHIYESLGFTKAYEIEPRFEKRYWIYTLDLKPPDSIVYTMATIDDVDLLVEYRIAFLKSLGNEASPALTDNLKANLRSYFKKALNDGAYVSCYATYGGAIAGVGGLLIREQPGHFKNPEGSLGYFVNMYTVPAFRRKGVCRKILERLTEEATARNIHAFELLASKEGEYVYIQEGFELHHEPVYRKYT